MALDVRLGCLDGNLTPESGPQKIIDAAKFALRNVAELELKCEKFHSSVKKNPCITINHKKNRPIEEKKSFKFSIKKSMNLNCFWSRKKSF